MLAVVDESDTMLATGRALAFEQVWGGRHLRMGGIAGVYIEPSARGQGVASLLMRALIARMVELGDVVSCLFPTAPELYRVVGYEVGGVQQRCSYAAHDVRAVRSRSGGLRPRPARPGDAELVHSLARAHQERHALSGPMLATVAKWREYLEDAEQINYVLDQEDGQRGFVSYSLADEVLTIEEIAAESTQATAALWAVVGSGFAPHVTASAPIILDDPEIPANSGHWSLSVSGGSGRAGRIDGPEASQSESFGAAGAGPAAYGSAVEPTRLGPRGLAALWSGWTMSRLRLAGLALGGGPETDRALDAMFQGTPFLTEYF
jgi:hypothetical protein